MEKSSQALRKAFLDYFEGKGHQIVPSASLVPSGDDTLLFTNAGMVQFKDTFLGMEKRAYSRAASSQRCVRAGGKHNDLENVGYTARHHTFFEMLGNFSFGDYFKQDAIHYAWEFLTGVLKIPAEKLWVSVYAEDKEAADIWLKQIKIDPARFSKIATSDNFWSMGDTGPCGPCTEIFYDHGPEIPGGPPGSPDEDGDRYIEIWNLVFMQYNRSADGELQPLPKPSVDTGMGLERLAAVMQGVHSNYEIDLFQGLIKAAAKVTGCKDLENNSLRVIADHIRSSSFLITDGVLPSNGRRQYVLRRIIRRAIRHGYDLGMKEPFLYRLVEPLCKQMGEAYPELVEAKEKVARVLEQEEQEFARTLERGMKRFDETVRQCKDKQLSGAEVFDLYSTYGFPSDMTADIARQRGYTVDWDAYKKAEEEHSRTGGLGKSVEVVLPADVSTEFTGYDHLQGEATIVAIVVDKHQVQRLETGMQGILYLDRTPFYAESGGQVGDTGTIIGEHGEFRVRDTLKFHSHWGELVEGYVSVGDKVRCEVSGTRADTARNHSATHLLHAALRQRLGDHVQQRGSLVEPARLRFDFANPGAMSREEILDVERAVNAQILRNTAVEAEQLAYQAAIDSGVTALFGEKYGDMVRVLRIGDYSSELCGGTHVQRAGDIGFFKIVSEGPVAQGIRRIEAVTGSRAVAWAQELESQIKQAISILKVSPEQLADRLQQTMDRVRELEKQLDTLQAKMATHQGEELLSQAKKVGDIHFLCTRLDNADAKTMRETIDRIKDKMGSGAVLLGSVSGDKVQLVAGVTQDLTKRLKAGDLVKAVAEKVGGKGGGRPDFAQAGGTEPNNLTNALIFAEEFIEKQLTR